MVTIRKTKLLLCRGPFLLEAQVLKLSTCEDVQNIPDTNMKRREFWVLKPKIIWTYKSQPTLQYHLKSQCQSAWIEYRGDIFIPTGNNTSCVNSWSYSSIQATVYKHFFTVDQYTEGKQKRILLPWLHWYFRKLYTPLGIIKNNPIREPC